MLGGSRGRGRVAGAARVGVSYAAEFGPCSQRRELRLAAWPSLPGPPLPALGPLHSTRVQRVSFPKGRATACVKCFQLNTKHSWPFLACPKTVSIDHQSMFPSWGHALLDLETCIFPEALIASPRTFSQNNPSLVLHICCVPNR